MESEKGSLILKFGLRKRRFSSLKPATSSLIRRDDISPYSSRLEQITKGVGRRVPPFPAIDDAENLALKVFGKQAPLFLDSAPTLDMKRLYHVLKVIAALPAAASNTTAAL